MSRRFIVFDTETTGLQKQAAETLNIPASIKYRGSEVCQIGGIILDEKMIPQKIFCHYCDTIIADSPEAAQRVHGISQREVRRYLAGQFLPEVMTMYLPEFFEPNVIFIGYNVLYDMSMVAQSLANSPIDWSWSSTYTPVLPRSGRYVVDVAEYVKTYKGYRKLSSFEDELAPSREKFIRTWEGTLSVDTNCIEMLSNSWDRSHNAFFDSLNTLLLWGERVWRKKLV